jgi:hypothetical protein
MIIGTIFKQRISGAMKKKARPEEVDGRLVGFGPGVPFKSSDFNDLPQN